MWLTATEIFLELVQTETDSGQVVSLNFLTYKDTAVDVVNLAVNFKGGISKGNS